jgi:GT2 family glycosyltransferase
LPHKVFFIWGEETEYLDRMSEAGFVRITVKNAVHYHKSTKFDYAQAPRVFYLVRNKIFMIRLHRGIYVSRFVFTISQVVVITRLLFSSIGSFNLNSIRDIIRALFVGTFQNIK